MNSIPNMTPLLSPREWGETHGCFNDYGKPEVSSFEENKHEGRCMIKDFLVKNKSDETGHKS